MAKYVKKPIVIEAFQYDKDFINSKGIKDIPEWVREAHGRALIFKDGDMYIRTLEGDMKVSVGDYIIKGVKGEIYPCKPDIFELTYYITE